MKCEHGVEGCIRSDFHGHLEPTPEDRERAEKWNRENSPACYLCDMADAICPGCTTRNLDLASLLATVRAEERVAVYREPEDALLHNAYITGKREGREEERMEVVAWLRLAADKACGWPEK